MKKLLGLFLSMLMLVGVTACDNGTQKVKLDPGSLLLLGAMITRGEDNIKELKNLAGTTWTYTQYPTSITRTDNTNALSNSEETIVEEIALTVRTITLTFNDDGTLTGTIREVFTPEMDEQYNNELPEISYSQESYTLGTLATNFGAYSGFEGEAAPGMSTVDFSGEWRKTKDYWETGGEDVPVYDTTYEVRILHYTYTQIVQLTPDASGMANVTPFAVPNNSVQNTYGVSQVDNGEVTLRSEDVDFQELEVDYASVDEAGEQLEGIDFNLPPCLEQLPLSGAGAVAAITIPDNVLWRLTAD